MIVKVQISLMTNAKDGPQVLVYNKNRKVWYTGKATPAIKKAMKKDAKAFFRAEMRGTEIALGKRAPWQEW